MKKIVSVEYKKLGEDGYVAFLSVAEDESDSSGTHVVYKKEEFFSEDWKTLIDRVLFFLVELVK